MKIHNKNTLRILNDLNSRKFDPYKIFRVLKVNIDYSEDDIEELVNNIVLSDDISLSKTKISKVDNEYYILESSSPSVSIVNLESNEKFDYEVLKSQKKLSECVCLKKGRVFAYDIIRTPRNTFLSFCIHHCISDQFTISVLEEYFQNGDKSFIEKYSFDLTQSYSDFDLKSNYWEEKSKNFSLSHSTKIKEDTNRTTFRRTLRIEKDKYPALDLYMRKENISHTSFFISVCALLWGRYRTMSKFSIGIPLSTRKSKYQLGSYVNTLPIIVEINDVSFESFAKSVQGDLYTIHSMRNTSLWDITKSLNNTDCDISGILYELLVNVTYSDSYEEISLNKYVSPPVANIDIDILVTKGSYHINLNAYSFFFSKDMVAKFTDDIEYVLLQLNKCFNIKLNDIDLKYPSILYGKAECNYDAIPELGNVIYQKSMKCPNHPALIYDNCSISYAELNEKINLTSIYLQERGIRKNCVVSVISKKNITLLVYILSLWKIGTFVEIFEEIDDSGISNFSNFLIENSTVESLSQDIKFSDGPGYIVSSSGSTGSPKKIVINHSNILSQIAPWLERYSLNISPRIILQYCGTSFDVFYSDIFRAFFSSSTLVIPIENQKTDMSYLYDFIVKSKVNFTELVPIVVDNLTRHMQSKCLFLNSDITIVLGGDTFNSSLVREVYHRIPNATLLNSYGVAECTIDNSVSLLYNDGMLSVGKPYFGTSYSVVNESNIILPQGTAGELVIGGACVSQRIYKNNKLDNSRLFYYDGVFHYKTGDLAVITNEEVHLIGRIDRETKFNGVRINLADLEHFIEKEFSIEKCIIVKKEVNSIQNLILFFIENNRNIPLSKFNDKIFGRVKISSVIRLESWPINKNGKIDRNSLMNLPLPAVDFETCATSEILSMILGCPIPDNVSFLNSGASSIHAFLFIDKLREHYKKELSLEHVYSNLTLKEIDNLLSHESYYSNNTSKNLIISLPSIGNGVNWILEFKKMFCESEVHFFTPNLKIHEGTSLNDFLVNISIQITNSLNVGGFKNIIVVGWSITGNFSPLIAEYLNGLNSDYNVKSIVLDTVCLTNIEPDSLKLSKEDILLIENIGLVKKREIIDHSIEQWRLMYKLLSHTIRSMEGSIVDLSIECRNDSLQPKHSNYGWKSEMVVGIDCCHNSIYKHKKLKNLFQLVEKIHSFVSV